ncbi:MAG: hypothetical protein WCR91_07975, partial [Sphaerochaetaceae bacterium]
GFIFSEETMETAQGMNNTFRNEETAARHAPGMAMLHGSAVALGNSGRQLHALQYFFYKK